MKVKCLNCGYEFELNSASNDELGWHTTCPECNGSFDLEKNEAMLVHILEDAKHYCKGELELDYEDGMWFAMDYRAELEGAFPIEDRWFNDMIITEKEAKERNIDVIKCCDMCDVSYVY